LDDDLFANAEKRQKNINVHVIISQMTDIDLRGARLSYRVPENVTVTRIAGSRACICAIKKQI
jgi:hypothetical protein